MTSKTLVGALLASTMMASPLLAAGTHPATGEALADALKNMDTGDMVFQGEAAVDLSPDAEKDDIFDEDKTEVLDGTRTISFEE